MGSKDSTRSIVQRTRGKGHPADVQLDLLNIEGIWTETLENPGRPFLIHDNQDNNNRVIIFASQPCLTFLSQSQEWFMDGNFKIAPRQFMQLYFIRCSMGVSAATCVYALLQKKTQQAYEVMFQQIINHCIRAGLVHPQPSRIHIDFEKATHRAIRQIFPHSRIVGCFYHLTQVNKTIISTYI